MSKAFKIPDPIEFLAWQLAHYRQRLAMAKTAAERSFLRRELFNLSKKSKPA